MHEQALRLHRYVGRNVMQNWDSAFTWAAAAKPRAKAEAGVGAAEDQEKWDAGVKKPSALLVTVPGAARREAATRNCGTSWRAAPRAMRIIDMIQIDLERRQRDMKSRFAMQNSAAPASLTRSRLCQVSF